MNADQLTDATGGGRACIGRRLDGTDIPANDRGDEPGINFLPSHKHDVRGLHHRVRGLDHADQPASFDHADCFADVCLGGSHEGQFSSRTRAGGKKYNAPGSIAAGGREADTDGCLL